MPLLDQDPIDPEIAATLDAIDATLAGEPVDGRYAEVAEIALLLASDRPEVPPAFAHEMDQKVERRFATLGAEKKRRLRKVGAQTQRRWSGRWEIMGALAAGLAALVAIVVVAGGTHGASSQSTSSAASAAATAPTLTSAASSAAGSAAAGSPATTSTPQRSAAPSPGSQKTAHSAPFGSLSSGAASQSELVPPTNGGSVNGSSSSASQGAVSTSAPTLQPPTTGRKVVQGAQLNLAAAPNRIDQVAQQIYDVIGQVNGVVENSNVTQGGPGGTANFQLSVPSGALGQTMSRLSSLNYATVVSRTDSTQDITGQYGGAARALADARALRTSLLKQLANATTTDQIDSLKAQIRDAEASISSDQATINRLNHSVNFSQLEVYVGAQQVVPPASHGKGGFTIGRAAHDAGHVLTVVAGVALIALAALTPIALFLALVWWVGSALKRRRREQALDSV